MRDFLCVKVKQRQILPGLPQADHPQASRRADAETTRPRYAVGAKKPLRHTAFQARFEQNSTHEKTGRGGHHRLPRPVFSSFKIIPFVINFYCCMKSGLRHYVLVFNRLTIYPISYFIYIQLLKSLFVYFPV